VKRHKKSRPEGRLFHPRNWIILQLVLVQQQEQQVLAQQLVQQEQLQQQELLVQQEQLQQLVQLERQLQLLVQVLLLFSSKRSKR
jgi:hypothetical protein